MMPTANTKTISNMKKKVNSKHIFDNNDDARKFYRVMKAAGYGYETIVPDGGIILENFKGQRVFIATMDRIRY